MSEKQKFYDISRFPPEPGMVIFGISMSKISNVQSADHYFEYIKDFLGKIVKTDGIGAVVLYSDYLYMYTEEGTPSELRAKYLGLMTQHKNSLANFLKTRNLDLVPKAYSFLTWAQLIIGFPRFSEYFGKLRQIYAADEALQKYVALDSGDKPLHDNQINFILEESLALYLISKGYFAFANDYIQHREQWILNCYPGKPLFTETYLYQRNFFHLHNLDNRYENSYYDLEGQVLYDFQKVDLETMSHDIAKEQKS